MSDHVRAGFNPIRELLKAAQIVGLDPRETTAVAIEELQREQDPGTCTGTT